jgi:hypothetical protein
MPAVQKYYEENAKRFEVAEQARVDYVVLSLDSLSGTAGAPAMPK